MTSTMKKLDESYGDGSTAPRITLDYIKSEIQTVYYMDGLTFSQHSTHADYSGKDRLAPEDMNLTTVCLMVMKSGFVVIGQSTPLSAENFDAAKGRDIAYDRCILQLWPMFGFAVKQATV